MIGLLMVVGEIVRNSGQKISCQSETLSPTPETGVFPRRAGDAGTARVRRVPHRAHANPQIAK